MDPEELGSANCLKRLIVNSEGIYLGGGGGGCFRKETINSLVFLTFSFMLLVVAHWQKLSTSCWRVVVCITGTDTTSNIVMSSINLYKGNAAGKSLTMTRKNRGPSFVPCGTPALIGFHEDLKVPSFTRCWRFRRKLAHQFSRIGGTPSVWSLHNKMLRLIL